MLIPSTDLNGHAAPARRGQRIRFRNPTVDDGLRVWELIAACPPLDQNSIYCNHLQCSHFADTCMLAEQGGDAVGWVSAYRPPARPSTLFIWQIAVHPKARGEGLGRELIEALLESDACAGVRRIETTITAANDLSWALFKATAQSLGAPLRREPWFDRDAHFDGRHDTEHLVRIGPFDASKEASA